jgi:hypothetical protein
MRQKACNQWYKEKLEHCSNSALFSIPFGEVWQWAVDKIFGIVDRYPHGIHGRRHPLEPNCQILVFDSVRDYIEIVPKYNDLFVQNIWLRLLVYTAFALWVVSCVVFADFQWPKLLWSRVMNVDFSRPTSVKLSKSLERLKVPRVIFNRRSDQRNALLDLINKPLENVDDVEDIIGKIRDLYQMQAKCRIIIDFEMSPMDATVNTCAVDQFQEALTEVPSEPVSVKPCCSVDMIENITEPQEMIDGKISYLSIPTATQVREPMVKPPATPSGGLPRPMSRSQRGGHVWKQRKEEERASLNSKSRHGKRVT